MKRLAIVLAFSCLVGSGFIACKSNSQAKGPKIEQSNCGSTVSTGVMGIVRWVEGNQMPTVGGGIPRDPSGKSVTRTIYFYEPTTMSEVTDLGGGFFKDFKKAPIKVIKTEANGCFKTALPAGKYSIFIEEKGGLWANRFDEKNQINVVEVKAGKVSTYDIRIDYKAAY